MLSVLPSVAAIGCDALYNKKDTAQHSQTQNQLMSLARNLKCTIVSLLLNTIIGAIYQAYYMHDLTRACTKNAEENRIGEGPSAIVYSHRAILTDGRLVAIKRVRDFTQLHEPNWKKSPFF